MARVVNITFPEGTEPLYRLLIKTKPKGDTLAYHARTLLQLALDSTTGAKRKK